MPKRLFETLRHEAPVVIHISMRDLGKRLAGFILIIGVCYYAGIALQTLAILTLLTLGSELAAYAVVRKNAASDQEISLQLSAVMWVINIGSTVLYLWPSILFSQQPSIALLLSGFMWLFGTLVHISNTFVALPLHNWSQMIPGFGATMFVFYNSSKMQFAPSSTIDWWIAAALMLVYAANTVETMTTQEDTQRALNAARAEANARLRALEHMTKHDGLTGLLTRRAFDNALAKIMSRLRIGQQAAVFVIDLDGFKPINDSYSHEAGDRVLAAVGERLSKIVGDNGLAARMGGDEFALALSGAISKEQAMEVAQEIARQIELPIDFEGKEMRVAASVGVALGSWPGDTIKAMCISADQAMYRAKSEAGTRAVMFDRATFAPRLSLDDKFSVLEALRSGRLLPYYQPKVKLANGEICGFEALARWEHETKGLLLPGKFLPHINEFGLHGEFLSSIAGQVLKDIKSLLDDGLDPGQVSINVPEVALATHSGRLELEQLLEGAPEAAKYVTFEITEDVFIARAGQMIQESVAKFRRAGVRISLDDFGTGFASFQHLRQLEFDELKIDTSFVAGLGVDPTAEVLVSGFLQIASGLGVKVVAEGVETDDQRAQLLRLGCRFGQGWLFGKAAPLEEARIRLFAEASRLDRHKAVDADTFGYGVNNG
ncbi:MAG: EAL domain-containing protein [Rhodobacteraceae bacterium]|nr:EAL domain-containing protein [Paracoccaceae bacterium]